MKTLTTALALIAFALTVLTAAQSLPFRYKQNFITGLTSTPVYITNARDGTRRLFILEQGGVIKVVQPGSTTPTEFLNITTRVLSGGERGLLGIAFHPRYSTNRRFFVYYTRQTDGAIQIAEYQANANDANVANTAEKIIITIPHPTNTNHNGGTLLFGPDGYLYAATGDGGNGNDPPNNAQNINVLLGKMLRIDVNNVSVGQVPQYNVPPTNPFVGIAGADEIYAYGLRNPFRFSFDRGGTNQLWAGDVGQNSWEEVDIVTLGGDYGWRIYEGNHCTNIDGCGFPANYVAPVLEYSSSGAGNPRCTVIGGNVYRGAQRAVATEAYVYADYCSGEIFKWENNQQTVLLDTTRQIVSFGEDEDGELYVVWQPTSGSGGIDKIMGNRTSADFDGDLKADRAVFRPANSTWYVANSSNGGLSAIPFGIAGDVPAPEDYDGDGRTDISVYRPSNSTWYSLRTADNTFVIEQFGESGDTPKPGDFDADGKADLNVFRSSTGNWFTKRSTDGGVMGASWGLNGDVPVPADFDGDNRFDYAVWRPSNGNWYTLNSTNWNISVNGWGVPNDIPAQGDFDGDGKADLMVYRQATGQWYLRKSSNDNIQVFSWGLNGDIPVASDYDGDSIDDPAVFRPSDGVWYIIGSSTGIMITPQWGLNGDLPVPKYDTP